MFFLPSRHSRSYIKEHRLPDVLALIQVLALDPTAYRSETGTGKSSNRKVMGLQGDLQGTPQSADSWTDLAKEHPEFFRVYPNTERAVSLVARHVTPLGDDRRKETLPIEFVQTLLETAIQLHDRQVRLAERWTILIPIWVAIVAGIFLLVATILERGVGA